MKADAKTEAAVLAVMTEFAEFYAGRDLEAVLALHTQDPDAVIFEPEGKHVGPVALRALVEGDLARFRSMAWAYGWTSVSAVGPVAWVAADVKLDLEGSEQEIALAGALTMVLERRGDKWLIAHSHVSFAPPK
jgi:ketosteroid isomerase-like protein